MTLKRRALAYIAIVATIITIYTLFYQYGMAVYEGRERSLIESLQTVVQSVTTTGYGQDAPWESSVMNAFTVLLQFTGVFFIFLLLPLFVAPWFEALVHRRPADTVEAMSDHVVISGHTPLVHAFIEELDSHDHAHQHVIVEPDPDRVDELLDLGHTVLSGDPEAEATLRAASVPDAEVAVVDGDDETVLNVTLAIRDVDPDVRIVAIVEDGSVVPYLNYAGADYVLQPRQVLGQALVARLLVAARNGEHLEQVLLLGHGTVGSTVRSALEREDVDVTVVDRASGAAVDVLGDATDADVLDRAGVETADVVVVTLPDDRQAVHATLLVREHNPEAHVCVRATDDRSVGRLERAGADHVHSLPRIAGQMLTATAFDEPVPASEKHLVIERLTDPSVEGQSLEDLEKPLVGSGSVVAIERDDDLFLSPGSDFVLKRDDTLIATLQETNDCQS